MNRQDLLEALRSNDYYKNLSNEDFFDNDNIDNLIKYIENTFAKTDESKKVILDILSGKVHNPNDLYNYRITQEELFKLNKKYYDTVPLYHGLNAYTTNLTDTSLDVTERIASNLHNIATNKEIELATSSTHMIGDIGIKGRGNSLFAQPWDMYSVVDEETGKRSKPKIKSILTDDDIFGIIEKYEKNPKGIKAWEKHDEVIAKNFEIESLWVKKDFYNSNQDLVLKLLKDNEIQYLDIIHSNSFEQYYDVKTERTSIEELDKLLTPQEAFDKYGPNDDRFYTSQGLDPTQQKEKISKLNKPEKSGISIKSEEYDNFTKENEQILKDIDNVKDNIKDNKTPKYKAKKGPKLKQKEVVQETIEKTVEETTQQIPKESIKDIVNNATNKKELPKKKLSEAASEAVNKVSDIKISKTGKIGLVAAALGIGAYAIGSNKKDNKKEEKQQTPNYQTHVANTTQANYNNDLMYNSYAQQMAKDISSYRYGKQMTGFV